MARRRKRLVDLVRDGTFIARKDAPLLGTRDPLPWEGLEEYRFAFTAQTEPEDAYEVARELERQLRLPDAQRRLLGDLQAELLKLGPAGSFEQLEAFFPRFFRHLKGPKAGQPFTLEQFQRAYLREFFRRTGPAGELGRRVYDVGLWGMPKGNGKTPTSAVLGTYAEVSAVDAPEVYVFAGSKDQADRGAEFLRPNIERGELAAWLVLAGDLILYPEVDGQFEILSADGDLAQGINPTAAIGDELWLFLYRKQRELWNASSKGLHKRGGQSFLLGITTAGFTKESLLGEIYDGALNHPKLEVHDDGFLLVLEDEESGFLMHWYGAPEDADIENPETVRRANPAPWIDPLDILRDLHRPGTDEYDWRRLNLNQWTKTRDAWLPAGCWARLRRDGLEPPADAEIYVAVDAALKYDTTAVCWAWRCEDDRIGLKTRVWSARQEAAHDVYVPGGRIRNELIPEFILEELAPRYRVVEVVSDPKFFEQFLPMITAAGIPAAEFAQQTALMRDAEQHFYEAATAEAIWHDGDPVFAAHMEAVIAIPTSRGWKLDNLRNALPIDAATAAIMARARAALQVQEAGAIW